MSHVPLRSYPRGVSIPYPYSNISDLQVWYVPSPLCSVITLLNIVLLSADIIDVPVSDKLYMFDLCHYRTYRIGSCRHM